MRQGQASRSGSAGAKREPIVKAVNPAGVSQIGSSMGNHVTENGQILRGVSEPLYKGRGYHAPMVGSQSRNRGSQGRY